MKQNYLIQHTPQYVEHRSHRTLLKVPLELFESHQYCVLGRNYIGAQRKRIHSCSPYEIHPNEILPMAHFWSEYQIAQELCDTICVNVLFAAILPSILIHPATDQIGNKHSFSLS
jgi:hypothetical protein